jgi:SHS2 domain-containing protein
VTPDRDEEGPEHPRSTGISPHELPVAGVVPIDHTADLGFEVTAPDFAELVRRAVLGMDWLLREGEPPAGLELRTLDVRASGPPGLLRAALREILRWHEMEAFAPSDLQEIQASTTRLRAVVRGGVPDRPPIREIKGVTLHGLAAEPRGRGWWGRVVFDV